MEGGVFQCHVYIVLRETPISQNISPERRKPVVLTEKKGPGESVRCEGCPTMARFRIVSVVPMDSPLGMQGRCTYGEPITHAMGIY